VQAKAHVGVLYSGVNSVRWPVAIQRSTPQIYHRSMLGIQPADQSTVTGDLWLVAGQLCGRSLPTSRIPHRGRWPGRRLASERAIKFCTLCILHASAAACCKIIDVIYQTDAWLSAGSALLGLRPPPSSAGLCLSEYFEQIELLIVGHYKDIQYYRRSLISGIACKGTSPWFILADECPG
jgi:hypothetical protein